MPRGIYERTPEMNAAKSKRQMGIPHTPEHNAAIKQGLIDAGVHERQRGIPRSPEVGAKISAAKRGVPHTSEAQLFADVKRRMPRTSPAQIAADESRRGVPHTSEAALAADDAKRGVPHSSEHIAAIKKGRLNSGADEAMRGGDDLVDHHCIYDHSDLSKYTTKMTRSRHGQLHAWMRKSGTIVPHINMVV